MEQSIGFETPRHGPFQLLPKFAAKQWAKGIAAGVVCIGFAIAMAWFAVDQASSALTVSRVWDGGVDATGEIRFSGEVTTHTFVLKDYELEVTFELPAGGTQKIDSDFMRFFTGPDENDEMGVRYLAAEPATAVTSWQHDALVHMWIWVVLIVALMALMGFGGVLFFRAATGIARKATDIAGTGMIDIVTVVTVKQETGQYPQLKLVYKLATGEEHKQDFPLALGGPFAVDETRLLALVALDRRTSLILRQDGWPLVWPPVAPSERR